MSCICRYCNSLMYSDYETLKINHIDSSIIALIAKVFMRESKIKIILL